jgi:hypothetical protein
LCALGGANGCQAVLAGHRRRQIGGDLLGFLDAAELLLELDETSP